MAYDFVEEEIEDYKEQDMQFHSSVANGSNNQHIRLVTVFWVIFLLNILFHGTKCSYIRKNSFPGNPSYTQIFM